MARDESGKMPDIDEELERLKNLGILKNDFMDGLYDDLFTASPAHGSGADPARPGETDPAGNAHSALKETLPAGSLPSPAKETGPAGSAHSPMEDRKPEGGIHFPAEEKKPEGGIHFPAEDRKPEGGIHFPAEEKTAEESGPSPAKDRGAVKAAASEEEKSAAGEEEDPLEALDKLIGLDSIKHDVRELTDFVRIQKMRSDEGLKSVPVSLHLVFTGNPGTGKTTVARILAKLYKKIGVLSKGQLVEVDRSGLVAGFVGQTALKTQEQIEKALGGVLFIDEAYALAQKDDAFGQEAIDTLLKAMEDHRDDLVVIVAGYTQPMEKFINSNPGLKSRFNKYIEFPDYSVDELMAIFEMNCRKYDYILGEDVKKHVREIIVARKLEKIENFANAREVRNLFEEIITNQAGRVASMDHPSQMDMMTIDLADLKLGDGKPADEKPADEKPADEKPAGGKTAAGGIPAGGKIPPGESSGDAKRKSLPVKKQKK